MIRLPVWATVTEAYRTVWMHRWLLLRFAAIPVVLILAIELAGAIPGQDYGVSPAGGEAEPEAWRAVAVDQAVWLFGSLIAVAFVVPCYRLLLLGPAVVMGGESWPKRRIYIGMLGLTALVTVLSNGPFAVIEHEYGEEAPVTWLLLGILYFSVIAGLSVKLAFLYPAICLGRPWELARRWQETAGNFWRLLAAFVVAYVPVLVVTVLAVVLLPLEDGGPSDAAHWSWAVEPVLMPFFLLVEMALLAAVTVIAHAILTGYPAEGVRVPTSPGGAQC